MPSTSDQNQLPDNGLLYNVFGAFSSGDWADYHGPNPSRSTAKRIEKIFGTGAKHDNFKQAVIECTNILRSCLTESTKPWRYTLAGGEAYLNWIFFPAYGAFARNVQKFVQESGSSPDTALLGLTRNQDGNMSVPSRLRNGVVYSLESIRRTEAKNALHDAEADFVLLRRAVNKLTDESGKTIFERKPKKKQSSNSHIPKNDMIAHLWELDHFSPIEKGGIRPLGSKKWCEDLRAMLDALRGDEVSRRQPITIGLKVAEYNYVIVAPRSLKNAVLKKEVPLAARTSHFAHRVVDKTKQEEEQVSVQTLTAEAGLAINVECETFGQALLCAQHGGCGAVLPDLAIRYASGGDDPLVVVKEISEPQEVYLYATINNLIFHSDTALAFRFLAETMASVGLKPVEK